MALLSSLSYNQFINKGLFKKTKQNVQWDSTSKALVSAPVRRMRRWLTSCFLTAAQQQQKTFRSVLRACFPDLWFQVISVSESTCLTCPSVCLHARSRVRGAAGVGADGCGGSSVLGGGDGCCQVRTPAPSGLGLKLSFVQTPLILPSSRQLERVWGWVRVSEGANANTRLGSHCEFESGETPTTQ